ncbi:hypothetical protein ACFSO7_20790 [Bacillus sp. CGMCC 1.16607]|uniref:hypothetical protein n=1 Tax=Bacillus sp. CGMCC 1.16607 TaxID=3351842 RepID=UPI00363DA531
MNKKPVFSLIALILSLFSLSNLGLIIPWDPIMDLHTYLGDMPMFAALIGTLLGIFAMIRKERKSLSLTGLLLNGIPLALFIIIMIMMFLSFVVGL